MAIPNILPEWNKTKVNNIEADTQHKDEGWLAPAGVPEKPPFQTFNWWQNLVYEWIKYFKESKVDTIAEMEAKVSPTDGDVVFVKDLNRGGTFIYDSAEVLNDDQGINFNGWIRQYDCSVEAKWFGAVGDGISDDTDAVNRWLSYVKEVAGNIVPSYDGYGATTVDFNGNSISLGFGTFGLKAPLDLTDMVNYSIVDSSICAIDGFVGNELILIKSSGADPMTNIHFNNCYLSGKWNVDNIITASNFWKLSLLDINIAKFRKIGVQTDPNIGAGYASHELMVTGGYYNQKVLQGGDGDPFPIDIIEGTAFEINNFDNSFSNIIISHVFKQPMVFNSGSQIVDQLHAYGCPDPLEAVGVNFVFDACYFDGTTVKLTGSRFKFDNCFFILNGTYAGIDLPSGGSAGIISSTTFRATNGIANTSVNIVGVEPSIKDSNYDELSGSTITRVDNYARAFIGSAYNNMLASRTGGVEYTNNSINPMFLTITGDNTTGHSIAFRVNGVFVLESYSSAAARPNISLVIPPFATYQLDIYSAFIITRWFEYS